MKKGQIIESTVTNTTFPNKGRMEAEGKTIIVKNGIPGQRLRCQITKVREGKAEARVLEVLERSSVECEPFCKHFSECGGCIWQTLPYEEQLRLKEGQVKELLDSAVRAYGYEYELENMNTAIRWNSPSGMRTKTDRWLWGCIKKAVSMIS